MDIIIFANGDMEDLHHDAERWLTPGALVIAADGGTRYALELDIIPAHIIGDMDSLGEEMATKLALQGALLHLYPPAKDETDLELALLWAAEQKPERIVVLGALGGRPDQELANYMLLSHAALVDINVLLAGGQWEIHLVRDGHTLTLDAAIGDTLSLLPLGGDAHGIVTQGLVWALDGHSLYVGPARGVSNVVDSLPVTISLAQGMLLVMLARGGVQR